MLEVLLYGKIDDEVKYACSEMINHLGLPHREVDDLRVLKGKDDAFCVILPETSRIEAEEIEEIRKSGYSVIFSGHIPEELRGDFKCRVIKIEGEDPPRISGLLKISGMDVAPFFYKFPILEFRGDVLQRVGEIEDGSKVHVGVILGQQNNRCFAIIAPQIFRSTTYLLSGSEATLPQKTLNLLKLFDEYERIDGKKTEIYKRGYSHTPIVNLYERLLLRILIEFSNRKKRLLVHKWFFPRCRKMAVCLTHDVEHAVSIEIGPEAISSFKVGRGIDGLMKFVLALTAVILSIICRLRLHRSKDSLRLLPKSLVQKLMRHSPYWSFDEYLEMEGRFGAISSFYFLMNRTNKDSDYNFQDSLVEEEMRRIRRNGCEVGLHASFSSYKDGRKIREEKVLLEKVLNMKVAGVRQHYLRMAIPETWRYQERAGFIYDSTFGYARGLGFRAGTCLPFWLWDFKKRRRLSILEIPLIFMDSSLFGSPYECWVRPHSVLSREAAFRIYQKLVDIIHENHGVLTILWHPHTLRSRRWRIDREINQSWLDLFQRILAFPSRYNPWYTSGEKLAEWWNLREQVILKGKAWNGCMLRFYAISPQSYKGFSIRIYSPIKLRGSKVFVNGKILNAKNIMKEGNFLGFSFDVLEGKNDVEVRL